MKNTLDMVKEFEESFGRPINDKPCIDDYSLVQLRMDLLNEEVKELSDALIAQDKVEVLDALCDIQYILDGTFLELGFWKVKQIAFEEVHNSNMSKLGADGKPIYREDGKIMKGPNFFRPNLKQFVDSIDGDKDVAN